MVEKFRNWMNENQGMAAGIFLVILVIVGYLLYRQMGGGGASVAPVTAADTGAKAYYMDLDTQKEFIDTADKPVPFQNAEGHKCVRMVYYTCGGGCSDANKKFSHYERYNEKTLGKLKSGEESVGSEFVGYGTEFSKDGKKWYNFNDSDTVTAKCPPNGQYDECRPQ